MSADGGNTKVVEMKAPDTAPRPAPAAAAPALRLRRSGTAGATSSWRSFRSSCLRSAAILWLTGGRYASTDNAYVQQDKVTITADVSGRIVDVAVARERARQRRRPPVPDRPRALPHRARRRRGGAGLGPAPGRAAPRRLRAGAGGGEDGDRRRRLQAEGLRSPAGAARQGHRLAGHLRHRPRTTSTPPSRR